MLPMESSQLLVGLDVETSDWDEHVTFAKQRYHFRQGFPCHADHTAGKGYVCGLGYCVFSRNSLDNNTYVVEEPVTIFVKLPEGESIAAKAVAYHGISDTRCLHAHDFSLALKPIIALLRQGAQIVCHNRAHETLAFAESYKNVLFSGRLHRQKMMLTCCYSLYIWLTAHLY